MTDPIRQVEMDDVGDDGAQELVVFDERGAARTVAVRRWHGWGFSLVLLPG